jgi:uncharacterized protein (DUF58 family)
MFPSRDRLHRWWLARLPASPQLLLGQQRIYLLPTRFGWGMLVVSACVSIGALNYGISLAYLLAFWLLALMAASVWLGYRQLAGLRLSQLPATPGFVGDEVGFSLLLEVPAGSTRSLCVRLLGEADSEGLLVLQGGQSSTITLACPARRRGRLLMPPVEGSSEAPFGLIRAFAWGRFVQYALAYPKPEPDPFTHGRAQRSSGGLAIRPSRGDEEFSHLSAYRPGESSRRVAWRVSARRDVLVSKRFTSNEPAGEMRLDWADYPSHCPAETRLSRLAWRVIEAERAAFPYRLCLPGKEIAPGGRQLQEALAALATFGAPV